MSSEGKVLAEDGVAVLYRGDVVLIVYQLAARLHRTRWLFDRVDDFAARVAGDFIAFMVVLPTADPPDAATRAENSARMRKLGPRVRRLVTAPIGDAFRVSIVRTVMRALAILQGKSGVHFISNTIAESLRRVREAAGPQTPSEQQLLADLQSLYAALGVTVARAGHTPR